MRKALRQTLLPALQALGFHGGPSHFMRLEPEAQDLLSVQWWKYGGSFILEFGRRGRGRLHTSWGADVAEESLDVAYLPVAARARLQDRLAAVDDTFAGFAFAGFGTDTARYAALAERVTSCLDQADRWLRTGEAGPDVVALARA